MAVIKSGTVSIAVGSADVAGTGTTWASGPAPARAGDTFMVPGSGFVSTIAAVTSDTALTLETARAGSAITGAAFEIRLDAPTRLSGVSAVAALAAQAVSLKVLERSTPLPKVAAVGGNTPPATPAVGTIYVVGSAPTGAWAGYALQYAYVESTGWRFAAPTLGDGACDLSTGDLFFWTGTAWVQRSLTAGAVRYDIAQALSAAQRGQVIDNLQAYLLSGTRNLLINGNFEIWQRGQSRTIGAGVTAFGPDRMLIANGTNATLTMSALPLSPGQLSVPGSSKGRMRITFATAPTTGSVSITQKIESVFTLAGRTASSRIYCTGPAVTEAITPVAYQNFGSGGSSTVPVNPIYVDVSTIYNSSTWARRAVFSIPSILNKVVGSNDCLEVSWVMVPRTTGPYDFARWSVVDGDATMEADPAGYIDPALELIRAQKYYEKSYAIGTAPGSAGAAGAAVSGVRNPYTLHSPHTRFRVQKRTTPSITVISPNNVSGTAFSEYNTDGVFITNRAIAIDTLSDSGFSFVIANNDGTPGNTARWHWSAEAEIP